MLNLIANAIDAMSDIDPGRRLLRVEARPLAGNRIQISVADTGTGMDREITRRIFEPFFTTKILGQGTGLGLPIVYSIIQQHDGFIDVRSEPARGTTFRVFLPLSDARRAPEERGYQSPPRGGTETILLAEDDEVVRLLTARVLSEFGYHVITATDGEDAVGKFEAHRDSIQLLLLDLIMPYRNGKEAFDEIRRISPEVRGIFMTTGYSPDILEEMSFEAGTQIIMKPFSPMELKRKVREMLDKREPSRHPRSGSGG